MQIALLWAFLAGLVAYFYWKRRTYYNYWNKQNIPCPDGLVPGIGHMLPVYTMQKNVSHLCAEWYEKYKNHSVVGFYDGLKPGLLLRDPELAKIVMQTNFTQFHENLFTLDPDVNPLLASHPFFTKGEIWITSRKRLTYAFSSMRLKTLTDTVQYICTKFDNFLGKQLEKSSRLENELKDLFSKFTAELVANAAMGIEGFCFEIPENPNSFKKIVEHVFNPSLKNSIIQLINFILPALSKFVKVPFIPKEVDRYMTDVVQKVMEERRKNPGHRNDFFQLMIDMEKTENDKVDMQALTSYILSFILDGYETTAVTLSYIGYELSRNPHVQDNLRKEIHTVLAKYNGEITYDAIKDMKYMDQVISESQRLHAGLEHFSKVCTEDTELKGEDDITYRVKAGTEILIPTAKYQLDPKYWNDPETFNPDRFSEENKLNIHKFTFLPFGEGPRMCVGMRMGLLTTKACLTVLLKNYKLTLSPKTKVPLEMVIGTILALPKGGLWSYIERA